MLPEALAYPRAAPGWGEVVLRPFRGDDVDMLQDLATDPYVPLIGSLPAHAGAAEAAAFVERQHSRLETGVGYSFCIADARSDEALGQIGLWLQHLDQGYATSGYSVAPRARRRGAAAAALRAVTQFGWTLAFVQRVELYIEPWNTASLRTAQAAGYAFERAVPAHEEIFGGRKADMLLYAASRLSCHHHDLTT